MKSAEIEDDGSVLKYMTKSEIEKQRGSLLIMTQRPFSAINIAVNPNIVKKLSSEDLTSEMPP